MRGGLRTRAGLVTGAAVLTAGVSSAAVAGRQDSPCTADVCVKARPYLKAALAEERAAVSDLREERKAPADRHLLFAQRALMGAGDVLGPNLNSGWDAQVARAHNADALAARCGGCARKDVHEGIDHTRWALSELGDGPGLYGLGDIGGGEYLCSTARSGVFVSGYGASGIGYIKASGVYSIPTPNAGVRGLTEGPDGAVWFTESNAGQIGRFDPTAKQFTEFQLPNAGVGPYGITKGPDGALWFTEARAGMIGKMTTSGQVQEYPIPTSNSFPVAITLGPDKALWFVEQAADKIGRITASGRVTEYRLPTRHAGLTAIAVGPGGLWFTEFGASKVGVISTKGKIREFNTPSKRSGPEAIVRGPDGDVWFTEYRANRVGVATPHGRIHEFRVRGNPTGMTANPRRLFYLASAYSYLEAIPLKRN